jgi:hypothetical protein
MSKENKLFTLETTVKHNSTFKNVSRNGDWINFSCILAPYSEEHKFGNDKSSSAGLTVAEDGKIYYKCFTCKHQGPFEKTLDRFELKSKNQLPLLRAIVEQEEELPDFEYRSHIRDKIKAEPLPYNSIFEDIDKYPDAQKYLLSRNISLTTAKNIGLEFDPEGNRIVFPVRDIKGVTYGYTGRTILPDGKPKIKDYYFQKSAFILGMELWKPQAIVLVEGLFAYAHLHEITKGKYFPYNIGAIMGSSISQDQADILIEFNHPIYILLDGDKAGKTGMVGRKVNGRLVQKGLIHYTKDHIPTHLLKYPEGKLDPDTLTYEELYGMLQNSLIAI